LREKDRSGQSERSAVVAKWKASGLSQAEFCRQEDFPEWKLSNWKRAEARRKSYHPRQMPRRNLLGRDWRSIVSGFAASGLTVADYCQKNGISPTSFKRARVRLARQAQKETAQNSDAIAGNPFVEIRARAESTLAAERSSLELILPGGTKVQVTEETPMHLLSKVIKALEVTC